MAKAKRGSRSSRSTARAPARSAKSKPAFDDPRNQRAYNAYRSRGGKLSTKEWYKGYSVYKGVRYGEGTGGKIMRWNTTSAERVRKILTEGQKNPLVRAAQVAAVVATRGRRAPVVEQPPTPSMRQVAIQAAKLMSEQAKFAPELREARRRLESVKKEIKERRARQSSFRSEAIQSRFDGYKSRGGKLAPSDWYERYLKTGKHTTKRSNRIGADR